MKNLISGLKIADFFLIAKSILQPLLPTAEHLSLRPIWEQAPVLLKRITRRTRVRRKYAQQTHYCLFQKSKI